MSEARYRATSDPFNPGQPVVGSDFFGRQAELSLVDSLLRNRHGINVHSMTRIGKTSLLLQIRHRIEHSPDGEGRSAFYLNAQEGDSLALEILRALRVERYRNPGSSEDWWSHVGDLLTHMNAKPLFLIDEGTALRDGAVPWNDLHQLASLHRARLVDLVIVTHYTSVLGLVDRLDQLADPFIRIFHPLRLPCFLPDEAQEMLVTLFGRAGIDLDSDFAVELAQYVGYHPMFLQSLGAEHFRILGFGDRFSQQSMEAVTQNWLMSNRTLGFALVHMLSPRSFAGDLLELAGFERDDFLINSMEAYGMLIRDSKGQLGLAPYVQGFLKRYVPSAESLDAVPSIWADLYRLIRLCNTNKPDMLRLIRHCARLSLEYGRAHSEADVREDVAKFLTSFGYAFRTVGSVFVFPLDRYHLASGRWTGQAVVSIKMCETNDDLRGIRQELDNDVWELLSQYAMVLVVICDPAGLWLHSQTMLQSEYTSSVLIESVTLADVSSSETQ